jgi:hypothetical protein
MPNIEDKTEEYERQNKKEASAKSTGEYNGEKAGKNQEDRGVQWRKIDIDQPQVTISHIDPVLGLSYSFSHTSSYSTGQQFIYMLIKLALCRIFFEHQMEMLLGSGHAIWPLRRLLRPSDRPGSL